MKKFQVLISLIVIMAAGYAQNPNLDYKAAIKVYNLTTYQKNSTFRGNTNGSSVRNTSTVVKILQPTVAFQWKTKTNNFQEIELTNFIWNKQILKNEIVNDSTGIAQVINGYDFITRFISVRYEYTFNFYKSKDKKFVPSLGFGFSPYYRQNIYNPKISTSFKTDDRSFGLSTYIIPRLTYYLSSKLFIDLNLPIYFSDTSIQTSDHENPAIPVSQQRISNFDFNLLPNILSGRIGLGLKL